MRLEQTYMTGNSQRKCMGKWEQTKNFLEENRDRLDPAFDAYEKEIRTILSY